MKTVICLFFLTVAVTLGTASAASSKVTLDVQNMTCAVCPITVKKSLEAVSGVQQVLIDYTSRTVMVQFDDTTVTPEKLTEETEAAGYPSTIKKIGK